MDKLTIVTNNVPRNIIYGYELPESARTDFDYIDAEDFGGHAFVQYKGNYYDLSDFMRIEPHNSFNCIREFHNWSGYHGDSYFSGVLIKRVDDERVIVGRYYN